MLVGRTRSLMVSASAQCYCQLCVVRLSRWQPYASRSAKKSKAHHTKPCEFIRSVHLRHFIARLMLICQALESIESILTSCIFFFCVAQYDRQALVHELRGRSKK